MILFYFFVQRGFDHRFVVELTKPQPRPAQLNKHLNAIRYEVLIVAALPTIMLCVRPVLTLDASGESWNETGSIGARE